MKITNINTKKGFTLIEMIVVIGLISLMTLLIASMLSQSVKNYRIKRQSVDLEEKSAHVLREFEQTTRAATKILTANTSELSFYRFANLTDVSPVKVRYFMSGTQFEIGVTQPFGTPPNVAYPSANEAVTLIIPNVTNGSSLFEYFDGNNVKIINLSDLSIIKMIGLTISLDMNTAKTPVPVVSSTKVNLRNMKNNL